MALKNKILYFSILLFFVFPFSSYASTLYFEPAEAQYGSGDTFAVNIMLDIDTQCINTVEANIIFPQDILRVVDFAVGQSILSLWIDNPSGKDMTNVNQEGRLHFAGGVPGGYCGKIPGDPGASNIVGKIIFNAPSMGENSQEVKKAKIDFLSETSVLLNDGLGTKDSLATRPAIISIGGKEVFNKNEWESEVKADAIQPEPFIIELQRDPNKDMYGGKYYIIFSTNDKQTGIDHYEVLEIIPNANIGEAPKQSLWEKLTGKKPIVPNWKRGESPYSLEDQSLESIIKVKAVDKAGNERIVEYIPTEEQKGSQTKKYYEYAYYIGIVIVLLSALFLLRLVYLRYIKIIK